MTTAKAGVERLEQALASLAPRLAKGAERIAGLHRLSGGASQETWAFDAVGEAVQRPLILRRAPQADKFSALAASIETEAAVIQAVSAAGAPVPEIVHVLTPDEGCGRGYVMGRLEGETIARKILRDAEFAEARPKLAHQCGEILARIHSVETSDLPPLRTADAAVRVAELRASYVGLAHPRPVFELALKWLEANLPPPPERLSLVHGDFRLGNLMIGPEGVVGVLDWELAHLGDPLEDLGWICTPSWRFGEIDRPVGGFGLREDLIAGHESVDGRSIDPARVKFWEVFGALQWGLMCAGMAAVFQSGDDPEVERGAIGRRASETEIDLLLYLVPQGLSRPSPSHAG
ncbi:MAG: phosphotransferase family protein [Pseudomonadota bacterium]|jgi:aminoglycoside phosphotransferase (APT) family kinase protein